ncbi:M24 family metallopeptidase [Natrinema caseinilyticum]|uniref:M24 family metallopeptidase n=1 Tax=Natrinema caseinilyticum TaxID=2961570 RepID=UPI0020C55E2F|nr:M24 family metallopeptidase [Natrinema caseinilyticum]
MDKRERLDAYLESHDLESVWFARPNSFAWLTGGRNVVDRETEAGVAAIGYDRNDLTLVVDNIESDRIVAEELPDREESEISIERFPWHASSLSDAIAECATTNGRAASDIAVPGLERVDPSPLRQPLTERDRDRYRELGRETAAAVESVCRQVRSDDTEIEVASALRVALSAREIEVPVVLVGGAERARKYRHYTPTQAHLGDYALVSVTAERAGLHASCTRTVAFDRPEWLTDHHAAAARVEVTALAETRAMAGTDEAAVDPAADSGGAGTAGDVFRAIQNAYAAVGHEGEWKNHHQGGAAGFAGREWIATPGHEAPIVAPMAYAWNPTVRGAKSEDTALVTDDGIEPLTTTGSWPTSTVAAVDRDVELERPAILEREE